MARTGSEGRITSTHNPLAKFNHMDTPTARGAGKCSLAVCPEERGHGLAKALTVSNMW